MIRATAAAVFACLVLAAAPAAAADRIEAGPLAAAAAAAGHDLDEVPVDAEWTNAHRMASRDGKTVNLLFGSYAVLQGLDMYSTVVARNRGAREANPLMNTGYAQAASLKAATSLATYFATRAMVRKNRKAAVITVAILNGVTGAIALNNLKNARR